MADANPPRPKNLTKPGLKKQVGMFLHRIAGAIRRVPYLTSAVALLGLVALCIITTTHAYKLDGDDPLSWQRKYKLALSSDSEHAFIGDFFVTHWKLGAKLLLPAFILALIRQRGKRFAIPLTLATLALFTLWIFTDIHHNWETAHNTTLGEVPAPFAYYVKLILIGSAILSVPFMFWLYHRGTLLDRYMVRSFMAPFMMCLLGIIAIYITMDLLNNANDLVKAQFSLAMVGEFYLRQVPQILVMIMDASVLLATLYTLSRMSRFNEIISMVGSGRSLIRILVPLFAVGLWASLIVMAMNYEWAPEAQSVKDEMLRKADKAGDRSGEKNSRTSREASATYNVMFRNREENRTWFMGRVNVLMSDDGNPIDFIAVIQDDGNGNMVKAWYAKRARWFPGINQWRFYDAHIIDEGFMKEAMAGNSPAIPSIPKLTIEESWQETPWSILSGKINPDYLSVQKLTAYLGSYMGVEAKKLARYETTWHSRFSLPFRTLLMLLIAAPLGIVTSRRGILGGVASSVALFVSVYFLYTISLKMGEGGYLPPWLAGWFIILVFSAVGLLLLWMKNYNRHFPSLNPLKWFPKRKYS